MMWDGPGAVRRMSRSYGHVLLTGTMSAPRALCPNRMLFIFRSVRTMLVDTHAHLYLDRFDRDHDNGISRDELIDLVLEYAL